MSLNFAESPSMLQYVWEFPFEIPECRALQIPSNENQKCRPLCRAQPALGTPRTKFSKHPVALRTFLAPPLWYKLKTVCSATGCFEIRGNFPPRLRQGSPPSSRVGYAGITMHSNVNNGYSRFGPQNATGCFLTFRNDATGCFEISEHYCFPTHIVTP